ncbi:uncharacterized protein B0I36DRAFT_407002 [Microdochium trichocladiopsis]|uniref:Uncharacterized protein n=1 Tax=Microdochium trichocladiopsis TaxID=1682393 RepID=A0A9P8Y8D1_9PEZI|nr:uncharacterized protein B0I36DRAFT_407002 [Microdochium trichocladiopsis]KAH7032586.1 hypothetical protein B0I36DRAFT_407002 [Microdochium trichocladiopsis]
MVRVSAQYGCECTEAFLRPCSAISALLQEGYSLERTGELQASWRDDCPLHKAFFIRKALVKVRREKVKPEEEQSWAWLRHIIYSRSYFVQQGHHESWLVLLRLWCMIITEDLSRVSYMASSQMTQAVQTASDMEGQVMREAYHHLFRWLIDCGGQNAGGPSHDENLTTTVMYQHLEYSPSIFSRLYPRPNDRLPLQTSAFDYATMPWEVRPLLGLALDPVVAPFASEPPASQSRA